MVAPKENYLGNYLGNYMKIKLVEINLQKAKAEDFYWLHNKKVYQPFPTGPAKWKNNMNLNSTEWGHFFKLANEICRENKLREFHFKFLHRIFTVTKKEVQSNLY